MEWMNYHHLLYFWLAAREGSVTAAAEELQLSAPTVSGQINLLEESLGQKLFKRAGRSLVMTDAGKLVYRYAEEIFTIGEALQAEVKGRQQVIARRLHIGISPFVSDLVAERVLHPITSIPQQLKIVVHTAALPELLGQLAVRSLDVVLTDATAANPKLNLWSHLLFESGTSIFATARAARTLKQGFPRSLAQSHFFLPAASAATRRDLEAWLDDKKARPQRTTECDDASLMAVLAGIDGAFAAPTPLADDLNKRYGTVTLGRADVKQRVYAITTERKPKIPAVATLLKMK
jgi:LysR family transcriptional regulator, transcriptional activator of nhaA